MKCRRNKIFESWSLLKDPFASAVDIDGKSKKAKNEDEVTVVFSKDIPQKDRVLYIPRYLELVIDYLNYMIDNTKKKAAYKKILAEAKTLYNHFGKTEQEFIVRCQTYTGDDIFSVDS